MTHQPHPNPARDIERIFALLLAVAFTAAIGFAGFEGGGDVPAARPLPRDANEQVEQRVPVRTEPANASPARSAEPDPALQRIDHAGAHHG